MTEHRRATILVCAAITVGAAAGATVAVAGANVTTATAHCYSDRHCEQQVTATAPHAIRVVETIRKGRTVTWRLWWCPPKAPCQTPPRITGGGGSSG